MLLYAYTSKQILHSNHDRHRRGNLLIKTILYCNNCKPTEIFISYKLSAKMCTYR